METGFDFQEWALLAKESPEGFEVRRRAAIKAFLDTSGDAQRRLGNALQREIDYEIGRAGTPQAALSAISKMMWDQVAFLSEELETLGSCMRDFDATTHQGAARLALALRSDTGARQA
ncbi:MAG: DUF3135 domain-containing protein [Rhodocyclales bacterium]|nr:DUF3135 domain-containing protein [Rhodocyclales bacterium]